MTTAGGASIGYARVSTSSQADSLEAPRQTLEGLGCTRVFVDVASGARADRPGLAAALDYARHGDTLTVTRLDRLGRSSIDTNKTVRDLDARGIRVRALDLDLDTATPAGRLVVTVLTALAEWERDVMIERTREGIAEARRKGKRLGRRPALTPNAIDAARAAVRSGMRVEDVAELHNVSRSTLYQALRSGDHRVPRRAAVQRRRVFVRGRLHANRRTVHVLARTVSETLDGANIRDSISRQIFGTPSARRSGKHPTRSTAVSEPIVYDTRNPSDVKGPP